MADRRIERTSEACTSAELVKKKERRERDIPAVDINNFRLKYQYFLQRVAGY
jgi:hypothetical protein